MPKYMNNRYRLTMNLQLFAEGEDDAGDDSGEGDDQDDEESDEDGEEEQTYTKEELDKAVKKAVARTIAKERRKAEKTKGADEKKTGDAEESEDVKARKAAEDRASRAEAKNACYEAGVTKDAVDDVVALARSYMAADEDLDLEDAIEKVVKKYSQFKKNTADSNDEEDEKKNKSWGQRQNGKASKKMSGVERKFYEMNPDLAPKA